MAEWRKEYRKKNKEKISKQEKLYRQNNKEKICEWSRQYRERNKVKVLKNKKRYYQKNKKQILIKIKIYRDAHKEYKRDNFLNIKGKLVKVKKRQFSGRCEVCGKENNSKLNYHHWDNSNLAKGIWVCFGCHWMVEGFDKNLYDKYAILKAQVEELFSAQRENATAANMAANQGGQDAVPNQG